MKNSDQIAQLTNTENKGRAYHEPFLTQTRLTMINNNKKINELEEEIIGSKITQKIAIETTNMEK